MDITPEFLEACRRVLSDQFDGSPAHVFGAMRVERLANRIRDVHAEIVREVKELADQLIALEGIMGEALDREMDKLAELHPAALVRGCAGRLAVKTMRETVRALHARADRIRREGRDDMH